MLVTALALPFAAALPGWRGPATTMTVPLYLWLVLGAGVVGLVVADVDLVLGLAVVWAAARALVTRHDLALATLLWFAFGAGAYVLLEQYCAADDRLIMAALVAGAGVQTALTLAGRGDVLFGNTHAGGAYIAAIAPLVRQPILLVILAVGVLASQSVVAAAALAGGLLVWHRPRPAVLVGAGVILALVVWARWSSLASPGTFWESSPLAWRLYALRVGLIDWLTHPAAVAAGFGLGAWLPRMWQTLAVHPGASVVVGGEIGHAHNEYFQWAYETGAVGVALLAAWLRRPLDPAWRPSVVAIAVLAAGLHVFHVAQLAAPFLVILARARAVRIADA